MNDPNAYTGGAGGWNPQSLVGLTLADRYRVERLLGEGGMGSVYSGVHVALRKKVAIKVLHQELCRDPTQVDRFLQEARAASMIGHENIVDIMDFGPVPGGSVFFVMEFLEGQDLADLLRSETRLPWARARGLMQQIVRALAAAHEKGIIHRDLKPANCFLVRRSDGRDFVKLLDFGIAKVTDPESGSSGGLTRTGAVFGTAKYMAPEQACGEPADQRTDIYAAAICLYEFLTGQVPYDGDNFMRVLSRHLTEPLTLPSTMAPDASISPAVEAIIVKALSKKPDDRYQSMQEFEDALLSVAPDGNFAASTLYEGPPQVGPSGSLPNAPGGTLWLGGQQQRPISQPPAIQGTAILHHGHGGGSTPPPEYVEPYGAGQGGAKSNPPPLGWASAAPPASHPPSSPHPAAFPTNPPPPTHHGAGGGDYTIFAQEPRSPAKLILTLALGGLVAIGGGGLAAWLVLRDDTEQATDTAETTPADEPKVIAAAPIEQERERPTLEIPEHTASSPIEDSPTPVETPEPPPTETPVATPDDDPPAADPRPRTTSRPRTGKGRTGKGDGAASARELPAVDATKDKLNERDVSRGFGKAKVAAKACPGGLPGMSIKVRATINQKGRVIDSKPVTNTSLPVARCVAGAVKSEASFPETTKPLDSKEWTYTF